MSSIEGDRFVRGRTLDSLFSQIAMKPTQIYLTAEDLAAPFAQLLEGLAQVPAHEPRGICGFDGFIDTFVRVEAPGATMAQFGPKVTAAAGISTSFPAQHIGDKFGGNGPLFASALHGAAAGAINCTYIGAVGDGALEPIFAEALEGKMRRIVPLAVPAHSDCLEFSDGKIMLSDLRSCAEVTRERLLERMNVDELDELLRTSDFIAAVNWGKLVNVGAVWEYLAERLAGLGVPSKKVVFFMDLAEFEQRPEADGRELLALIGRITRQCQTILSLNLKEAWQMGTLCGLDFHGQKEPGQVTALAAALKERVAADRIVIHPNNGAACASETGTVYVPGPFCREPLISVGAGDNFGAGCLMGALRGFDDTGMLLSGVCTSGFFVRSGRSPNATELAFMVEKWRNGVLPERIP
jgi:hypothetical protein